MPSRKCLLLVSATLVIAVAALSIALARASTGGITVSRDMSGTYTFTNPLLDYEDANMAHVSIFSESVESKVASLKEKYGLSFASVYYRDLNNGQWIGVNEEEPLDAASLIKLPILLSLYKQAEADPTLLDKKVVVLPSDASSTLTQNIPPADPVKVGSTYTIKELADRMITQSDNVATQAILRNINEQRADVYKAIGVRYQDNADNEVMITVKNYAAFFRVLFNATYLNRDDSEAALALLSHVQFTQGLVAGVPAGTKVAHKFGERADYFNGLLGDVQLHDCGIIYYPKNPYLLCVMTRGDNLQSQEGFIADMSRYFYGEVGRSLHPGLFGL